MKLITNLLLISYLISLLIPLNIFNSPNISISFILAAIYSILKVAEIIKNKHFYVNGIVILSVILYIYLFIRSHIIPLNLNQIIENNYFISYGLNLVLLILLNDEFKKYKTLCEDLTKLFIYLAIFVSILIILNIGVLKSSTQRITFLSFNQNELAAAMVLALSFMLIECNKKIGTLKSFCLILAGLTFINSIILSGTRFALITAVIILLVNAVFNLKLKIKIHISQIIAITYIVYIYVHAFAQNINSKIYLELVQSGLNINNFNISERMDTNNSGNNLKDLGGRLQYWESGLNSARESVIFGNGFNGYMEYVLLNKSYFELPHNFIIEVLAIGGMVGILFLSSIFLLIIINLKKLNDLNLLNNALLLLIPILIIICMLNIIYIKIFWFCLAIFINLFLVKIKYIDIFNLNIHNEVIKTNKK